METERLIHLRISNGLIYTQKKEKRVMSWLQDFTPEERKMVKDFLGDALVHPNGERAPQQLANMYGDDCVHACRGNCSDQRHNCCKS